MPHEGYADPVTNDGPGFCSNIPVSELTDHVTRTVKASDVNSTPPVAKTMNRAIITKTSRPSIKHLLCAGAQGRLDSQGDRTRSRRMIAQILGGGTYKNKRCFLLLISLFSPQSITNTYAQQRQGVGYHLGANKGIDTPFLK